MEDLLTALRAPPTQSALGQSGTGEPAGQTLANPQGGTTGVYGAYNPDAFSWASRGISNQGANQLRPGSLEQLDPSEIGLFRQSLDQSIGSGAGDYFLREYERTRPQQQAATGTRLGYA